MAEQLQEMDAKVDALENSGGGVEWAGYSNTWYVGDLGVAGNSQRVRRGHIICDTLYPSSRWCSYEEIMSLGIEYPCTRNVWIHDAAAGTYAVSTGAQGWFLKSGKRIGAPALSEYHINCLDWASPSQFYYGGYMTGGAVCSQLGVTPCNSGQYLPCCY